MKMTPETVLKHRQMGKRQVLLGRNLQVAREPRIGCSFSYLRMLRGAPLGAGIPSDRVDYFAPPPSGPTVAWLAGRVDGGGS
jgi:hypothetical protein